MAGRTIEKAEHEGEADGDNGTGEKCMKLEMEGEWTRRRAKEE
jgi:hypothetical protein